MSVFAQTLHTAGPRLSSRAAVHAAFLLSWPANVSTTWMRTFSHWANAMLLYVALLNSSLHASMVGAMLAARHLVQGRERSNSRARSAQLGELLLCNAVRDSHARYCLLQKRTTYVMILCSSLQSQLACKAKQSLKSPYYRGRATCRSAKPTARGIMRGSLVVL